MTYLPSLLPTDRPVDRTKSGAFSSINIGKFPYFEKSRNRDFWGLQNAAFSRKPQRSQQATSFDRLEVTAWLR